MAAAEQGRLAAIFKRGGQKADYGNDGNDGSSSAPGGGDEQQELEQHFAQLAEAWAAPKTRRGMAAAVWRPELGAFEVVSRGRQLFAGHGFMHNKRLYLNAEEAVYLMDRAVALLFVEEQQQQQRQQQQQQQQRQQQQRQQLDLGPPGAQWRLLSMQEAMHMLAVLDIPADRLMVLSHLSRLGFIVRRHPACWLAPPEAPPCTTWQANPAWAATDGLCPAAPGAAAALPPAAADAAAQQQPSKAQQQPHQDEAGAASSPDRKRQVEEDQQQQEQQEQQQEQQEQLPQQQQELAGRRPWYAALPAWLGQQQQQRQQQQQHVEVEAVLPGVRLQQQFPLLRPLQRYRDTAGAAAPCASPASHGQQHSRAAELVYDARLSLPSFSYKLPPRPQFSVAMPAPGHTRLPPLDELLDLAAAAAGGQDGGGAAAQAAAAAAAAPASGGHQHHGQQQRQQRQQQPYRQQYRPVRFALPEEGDVSFCEVVPLRLMDLLANSSGS